MVKRRFGVSLEGLIIVVGCLCCSELGSGKLRIEERRGSLLREYHVVLMKQSKLFSLCMTLLCIYFESPLFRSMKM